MSRVFVIQNQQQWSDEEHTLKPKYDFSPAEEYGELHFLLDSKAGPHQSGVVAQLQDRLSTFTANDYLLLVGNPALIGFACAIAADVADGHVNILQWNRHERRYEAWGVDL